MTREEVIRLAKEADAYRYVNRAAKDEPTHTLTVEKLEAFAELVAAEYKRDALRYLWLKEQHPSKSDGWAIGYFDGYGVDCWQVATQDLDSTLDAAMEKVK